MGPDGAGDSTMTAALARLETVDAVAAADARAALEWLVGDSGLASLSRYGIQQFCWYELPFKWIVEPAVRREIVIALARFFDLAGLARYAELCRSDRTMDVLAAWADDPSRGFDAYKRAADDSGVEPPNLPELTWSSGMGADEFAAFWSTAMALEVAIDAGALVPGAKGWRNERAAIARAHLVQPREELFGASYLQSVWTARLGDWIEGPVGLPSRARAQLLAPVANALLHPVDPPRGVARPLAPLLWLLDAVDNGGDGLLLTQNGNLPRSVAHGIVEAFPSWWPAAAHDAAPSREHDVPRLVLLHELARETKLVRRTGRRLQLTRRGHQLRGDPKALWQAVAEHQAVGSSFAAAVNELVFAALLVEPLTVVAEVVAEAMVVLTESGWHDGAGGAPVPRDAVLAAVDELALRATTLGWVREKGRQWPRRQLRLTETGRATALAALRARALAPRVLAPRALR